MDLFFYFISTSFYNARFYNDKNVIGFIAKAENKIVGFAYGYDIILSTPFQLFGTLNLKS